MRVSVRASVKVRPRASVTVRPGPSVTMRPVQVSLYPLWGSAGLWWWTFNVEDEDGATLAMVDRNWRGLGLEVH